MILDYFNLLKYPIPFLSVYVISSPLTLDSPLPQVCQSDVYLKYLLDPMYELSVYLSFSELKISPLFPLVRFALCLPLGL